MRKTYYFNKERKGFRGKKQRYSVWKAEYNQKWERCYEEKVRSLCAEHNLNVADWLVDVTPDTVRRRWGCTLGRLIECGYHFGPRKKEHAA